MHTYQVDNLIQWAGTLAVLGFFTGSPFAGCAGPASNATSFGSRSWSGSASQEFVALLETEGGRQWMADALAGRSGSAAESRQRAIVLAFLGAGLIASAFVVRSSQLGVMGGLVLSGSLGQWVATWVAGRRSGAQ